MAPFLCYVIMVNKKGACTISVHPPFLLLELSSYSASATTSKGISTETSL